MDKHTNRLSRESSPYLLQHAHNPVDWYPWGEEAFAEARRRGVPIFLSVGYSTCYWCHVMERESFEDTATAAVMNELFVCVKVDREERPDVDELSMAAAVTFTGRGGWPTSVFLEPDGLRPFFAGTYFPLQERQGMPSFTRVLQALSGAWKDRCDEVREQAATLAGAVAEQLSDRGDPVPLGGRHAQTAVATLLQIFDRADGGFGGAPKFPQPIFLDFLLDARERSDAPTRDAIDAAVRLTLDRMAAGGMHDHLAGGFHRYSVDRHWTVPHFEKMLYDNAQLAELYARAAQVYGDDHYRAVAARTAGYVLREMSGGERPGVQPAIQPGVQPAIQPGEQGFFSAQDAEVDSREGLNYLWTPDQFDAALDAADAAFAKRVYGLDTSANFQDPHHPDDPPAWVLRLEGRPETVAERMGMPEAAFSEQLTKINARLLAERTTRKQPFLDDKVLAGWNGLMIAGLVRTGEAIGGDEGRRFIAAAERAARFVLASMRSENAGLLRSYRAGRAAIDAPLEDHAFVVRGLLALARSGSADTETWLASATDLTEHAERVFGDGAGGYFDTTAGRADLFVRARSTHDGATPSAAGVVLHNLLDLHTLTGDPRWLDRAVALLAAVSPAVESSPVGALNPVRGLLRLMSLRESFGDTLQDRYTFDEGEAAPMPARSPSPVKVLANTETVEVHPDTPGLFKVAIQIDPGYHIVAAAPGEAGAGLSPLRVGLTRGSGVAVYADYPKGETYGVASVGEILVHQGRVEFDVVLEHKPGVGVSAGTPVLGVSYQACSDTECLPPRAVELEVGVLLK